MVMPCSRSAARPSTSRAKSISSPWVPWRRLSRFQRAELVVEQQPGVVQQPPDQGALAVVHAAAGDEAQQVLGLVLPQVGGDLRSGGVVHAHQK